jgi:predicted TIM-barrel fold metal-dependent hydrolase
MASGPTSKLPKIDVHSHFLPPTYRQACLENGHANPDGMPALPEWSAEAHLALMNKLGITKSILSISSPGTNLVYGNPSLAQRVTRECNAYAADLKKRHPDRFGYWASLPIPDVDLCLKEIAKSAEEGCDGYVLLTNGHGHYLGDKSLDPVFDELNRRNAILFIHPTSPCIKCDPHISAKTHASTSQPTQATPLAGFFPNPMLEFFFDTARVLSNLFLSGTMKRCPSLKIILPHLAGASPPLLSRWTGFSTLVPVEGWETCPEEDVLNILKRQFWFDLAGFPFPYQLNMLMDTGIDIDRFLYGSDFPFTKAPGVEFLLKKLDEGLHGTWNDHGIGQIYSKNAAILLGGEGKEFPSSDMSEESV